jgi:hypothetical protein
MSETVNEVARHPGSPEGLAEATAGRHPGTVGIVRYFAWSHLPEHLRPVSAQSCELARAMVAVLPDGPELTAGLRKLLEAKDCFVRAALDRPAP